LARERVAQEEVRNWSSSPDGRDEMGGGMAFVRSKAPIRDSERFTNDNSSMEMSIREVKKIKKLTPSVSRKHLY
jgi:hypothetical protein